MLCNICSVGMVKGIDMEVDGLHNIKLPIKKENEYRSINTNVVNCDKVIFSSLCLLEVRNCVGTLQ